MQFEFATSARIIFGTDTIARLPDIARDFGARSLFVTGRDTRRAQPVLAELQNSGTDCSVYPVDAEPTIDMVRDAIETARNCDLVIGFGGGSVIDAAKAIAALAPNSGEPLDYVEIIGSGRTLERPPLPFIAIPTTAGTGAEVTRNAVLDSPEHRLKVSLRSPLMLPKVALVDPNLTLTLPPSTTASTGLDALTQLIEPYVSNRANALTDLFCLDGMKRIAGSLIAAFRNGHDQRARESMSYAALLGGLALANAGLGVVHGFAAPLGALLHAPHGALCAAVLPHGMAINIRVLRDRAPEHQALQRYREIARALTGDPAAEPEDAARWVAELCRQLSIPSLRAHKLDLSQIPDLVQKAKEANSMKANPIPLTTPELTEIAERAL